MNSRTRVGLSTETITARKIKSSIPFRIGSEFRPTKEDGHEYSNG